MMLYNDNIRELVLLMVMLMFSGACFGQDYIRKDVKEILLDVDSYADSYYSLSWGNESDVNDFSISGKKLHKKLGRFIDDNKSEYIVSGCGFMIMYYVLNDVFRMIEDDLNKPEMKNKSNVFDNKKLILKMKHLKDLAARAKYCSVGYKVLNERKNKITETPTQK